MKIWNVDFEEFARRTREEKKQIVLWGLGTFFHTCIPYLLREYGLEDQVCGLIDKDEKKWGREIPVGKKSHLVRPPSSMVRWRNQGCRILITSSYFAEAVDELEAMEDCAADCFVAAFMFPAQEGGFRAYQHAKPQIPRVIHYCWFGRGPISEKSRRCIDSWKKWCPGYEIVRWNEDNYDVKKNPYMAQAYEMGRYGYVPDYARIDLLYHYGGLYFDTDVELVGNIDELLYLKGFTSFEEYPMVNFGGGSGSVKGLGILKEILDFRSRYEFRGSEGTINKLTCGFYETTPLYERGLRPENRVQNVEGLTVLPSYYFHVKSSVTKEIYVREQTLGIHDFNWSWVSEAQKEEQRRTGELVRRYFRQP